MGWKSAKELYGVAIGVDDEPIVISAGEECPNCCQGGPCLTCTFPEELCVEFEVDGGDGHYADWDGISATFLEGGFGWMVDSGSPDFAGTFLTCADNGQLRLHEPMTLGYPIDCVSYLWSSAAPVYENYFFSCSPSLEFEIQTFTVTLGPDYILTHCHGFSATLTVTITPGPCGAVAAQGESRRASLVRPVKCKHLGRRTERKTGCAGWRCKHDCNHPQAEENGHPKAIPLTVCQTCPDYEPDPDSQADYDEDKKPNWLS